MRHKPPTPIVHIVGAIHQVLVLRANVRLQIELVSLDVAAARGRHARGLGLGRASQHGHETSVGPSAS